MRAKGFLTLAVFVAAASQILAADEADLSKLASANNTFAFNLFKLLASEQPGANIFVPPYSAATTLQMAASGAAGLTKAEMRQVLGITNLTTIELNHSIKATVDLLNATDTNLFLITANALWYRQGVQIKPGFLEADK